MARSRVSAVVVLAILLAAVISVAAQVPTLRVTSAGPTGELTDLSDAGQVRILFSEPMVSLGSVRTGTAPSWIHISPALPGTFYWSGTQTLIFSPDAATQAPFATTFTVRVDADAASATGHTLGAPYSFTFSTPTVRLISSEWYRKDGRFDSPAVIVLRFNQPVRPGDVVAHARVSLEPHAWQAPALPTDTRARWRQISPADLQRFDAKVATVRRVTSSSAVVDVRVSGAWDENRFPRSADQVVIETTTAPPSDGWLRIAMDAALPSPAGPLTHPAQSTLVQLEPTFFVRRMACERGCTPGFNSIELTRAAQTGAIAQALTVADVTDPAHIGRVSPTRRVSDGRWAGAYESFNPEDAGFDPLAPARVWRIRLAADLRAFDGQTLGYSWLGLVETTHAASFIAFSGSVWEASGGPRVPLSARNVYAVSASLAAVQPPSLIDRLNALNLLHPPVVPPDAPTLPFRITPDVIQAHGLDLGSVLSPNGTGLVSADVAISREVLRDATNVVVSPHDLPSTQHSVLQVTNLGISVKDSPQSTLVFVTRLDTGEPIADAHVTILDGDNATEWRGTTDRDGVALAPALTLRPARPFREFSFVVTAEKDGDLAFVTSNWEDHSLYSWDISYDLDEAQPILRGSVFTDRGVYKPREDVHVKAVLREDTPTGVRTLPAETAFDVVVRDVRDREVDRRRIVLNRWSTADWTWHVPDEATLGTYRLDVLPAGAALDDGPAVRATFRVAAFRQPDFRVDTTLAGEPAILGSALHATIQATYLFGAALGARPANWVYGRVPVQHPPDAIHDRYPDERYAIGYLPDTDPSTEANLGGQTESLGPDGRATVTLQTTGGGDVAYSYAFGADVEAASRQHVANRTSLVVHPASLYVVMSRPPVFVDATTGMPVGITAVDLSGKTVADVDVIVSLVRYQWMQGPPNKWGRTEWVRREVPSGEWTVRTGAAETMLPVALPGGGSYTLRAKARDGAGRQTRTELDFYGFGSGPASWRGEGHQIDLIPERKTWKPGESARIMIPSPWPKATALLTVEREGIRSYRRFTLTSTQDVVEVPITEADVPNVYVSVLLVKGRTASGASADVSDPGAPAYRVGYTDLTVDDASKRLHVSVSADRDEYRPRDPVKVSVAVAAPDGRPAAGEVTLWAVDYGRLSLTGYTTPDVLGAVYVRKALQVMTADSRARLMRRGAMEASKIRRPDFLRQIDAQMGSLAVSGEEPGDVVNGVREDFRPLAFWLGSVVTDSDGRATTTATLPESLTTYRIMAVAGDEASRFGSGEREIRVSQPLTLLAAFPRFLSKGDRASFGAVVTNNTKTEGIAEITIESLDPQTLQFAGTRQSIRLAPGASQPARFDAVAAGSGEARVRVHATLGSETDALQMPITINLPLRLETTAAYGDTIGSATEQLALPAGILPSAGGLTVELASTALVGLGESARYLDEYPYDCAEQKASRALALLLASDLDGVFTLANVSPADYRTTAASLLRQLSGYQCNDGSFGLWPGLCGKGSAYLTAYVLHVLKIAQAAQVSVDAETVDRALDFLRDASNQRAPSDGQWWPVWAVTQAYSLKVLDEYDRGTKPSVDQLVAAADRLPMLALSYLADVLASSNDKGPRYQDIVRRLTNRLRVDADRAHVEEQDTDALAWLWNTNERTTAVVLEGFVRRKDDATLVAPLVRWLLAARTSGRWGTTHENAMALEALVAYYRTFETATPRMTAVVTVGSTNLGTVTFDGRSTTAQTMSMAMPDLLKKVPPARSSTLSISRTGTGRLFYTARVQTSAPVEPEAVDRGFSVERRYEVYAKDGANPSTTTFKAGDVIRVTVVLTIRGEGRYLALTDPLPAGFEPLEDWALTTPADLALQATRPGGEDGWLSWWRGGFFDHVEKHDDHVVAFATRLASGRHEFSYLVRATTTGTFDARGASVEAMYAPELTGRSQAATLTVK